MFGCTFCCVVWVLACIFEFACVCNIISDKLLAPHDANNSLFIYKLYVCVLDKTKYIPTE